MLMLSRVRWPRAWLPRETHAGALARSRTPGRPFSTLPHWAEARPGAPAQQKEDMKGPLYLCQAGALMEEEKLGTQLCRRRL